MQPPPLPNQFMNRNERGPRYTVLRQLASGGMGNLYLARARGIEGFERLVVLKRLRPEVAGRQESVKMFLDEVRVLASMQHNNVVHIYDIGVAKDGSYFYSMEFLVGQDLRRLMVRGLRNERGVPLPQALFIASSVLSGLHHVHRRVGPTGEALQIVHRDVSPANIFVTYEGGVKLIDFGIAKTNLQSTHTELGVIKGKIRYMSPEQCRMEQIDARSDVFSLGVVLWEMTTGRGLLTTQNPYETLVAIAEKDAPRPSLAVPDYPKDLEAVVMKALARRVSDRWQSAKEMQLALEELAVNRHWPQSASGLSELMESRFSKEIAALRDSERAGQELADFAARELADVQATPSAMSPRLMAPARGEVGLAPANVLGGSASVPWPKPLPDSSRYDRERPRERSAPLVLFGLLAICVAVGIGFVMGKGSEREPVDHVVADALRASTAVELVPHFESVRVLGGTTTEAPRSPPRVQRVSTDQPPALPSSRGRHVAERSGDGAAMADPGEAPRRRFDPPRRASAGTWSSDSPFPPP